MEGHEGLSDSGCYKIIGQKNYPYQFELCLRYLNLARAVLGIWHSMPLCVCSVPTLSKSPSTQIQDIYPKP